MPYMTYVISMCGATQESRYALALQKYLIPLGLPFSGPKLKGILFNPVTHIVPKGRHLNQAINSNILTLQEP